MSLRDTFAAALARPDAGPAPLTPGPVALVPDAAGDPPDTPRPSPAARRIDRRDAPGAELDHGDDHPAADDDRGAGRPARFPVHVLDPVPTVHAPAHVLYADTRTLGTAPEYVGLDLTAAGGARVAYLVVQAGAVGNVSVHAGRSALTSQRFPLAAGAGLALDGIGGLWLSSPDGATVSVLVAGIGPAPR